jgi:hypothetical protein
MAALGAGIALGTWSMTLPSAAGAQGRAGPAAAADVEPAPRLADGRPNLGRVPGEKGIWMVPWIQNMADWVIGENGTPLGRLARAAAEGAGRGGRGAAVAPAGRGSVVERPGSKGEPHIPFMPWSAAVYDYNSANNSKYDPEGYCLPPGGPRLMATPYPMEIIQLPEQQRMLMIFEGATHIWREIHLDDRPHPQGDALNPTFLGHSVGRWVGDMLVVDVVGFNENSWLDFFGHPHTDQLHVIERFARPNKATLRYEATIDDPGAYTRPWTAAWTLRWNGGAELQEYICQENNQYMLNLTDDFGQPLFRRR